MRFANRFYTERLRGYVSIAPVTNSVFKTPEPHRLKHVQRHAGELCVRRICIQSETTGFGKTENLFFPAIAMLLESTSHRGFCPVRITQELAKTHPGADMKKFKKRTPRQTSLPNCIGCSRQAWGFSIVKVSTDPQSNNWNKSKRDF